MQNYSKTEYHPDDIPKTPKAPQSPNGEEVHPENIPDKEEPICPTPPDVDS